MRSIRLITVVGARPQFIKAAAVSRAIAADGRVDETLVHTGQHYDDNMSDVFFRELAIPAPKHHLGLGGASHGAMTGRMLEAIEAILLLEKPDGVLVYGDTNSTLAGALAAAKLHIPVIHVEAGLRSFNKKMPEEINRILTDHVSGLLLCPTETAVANLAAEGVSAGVFMVGDVMHDATLFAIDRQSENASLPDALGLKPGFVVLTLHRAENTDDGTKLHRILEFVRREAMGRTIVFPVHPRTRAAMERYKLETAGLLLVEPLGYFDLHGLLAASSLIMTDSGGLQKEAYFHRKPCITLREETEWVETIHAGWNRLWTVPEWVQPRTGIDDYGTGHAGALCAAGIARFLGGQNLSVSD